MSVLKYTATTRGQSKFQKLLVPAVTFLISTTPIFWDPKIWMTHSANLQHTVIIIRYFSSITLWLSGVWFISRFIDLLVWDQVFYSRFGTVPPRLLKDLTKVVLVLIALTGVLGGVFNLPVSGIWATSGMVGLVFGLALQHTITDAFSGLAMNFDDSLSLGEWVQIHQRGLPTYTGKVVEVNWRTTQILTKDQTTIIFPNSLLSRISIINLSRPQPMSRFKLELTFPKSIDLERVQRTLFISMYETAGILESPAPQVRIRTINQVGIVYQLRYWVDPIALSPSKARSYLLTQLQKHLKYAQFHIAFPSYVREEKQKDQPHNWEDNRLDVLKKVSLFKHVSLEILEQLALTLKVVHFMAKQEIVQQGEIGYSMFIVAEGVLEAYTIHNQKEMHLGNLVSEDFFGEYSLLTGEVRSAYIRTITSTTCYEISYESMIGLLTDNPSFVDQLSAELKERSEITSQLKIKQDQLKIDQTSDLSVAEKIRKFFLL
jgi:small-conductance mechanosensitive channel/CRP-like cAMP-binding protein